MKKLSFGLRHLVKLFISVLASSKLMEILFKDLPDLNFIFCSAMLSIMIFVLLVSYGVPAKAQVKRPLGNYFKEQ